VVAANADSFLWITDDGGTAQVISARELCGPDFEPTSATTVRASPNNPDLLLVSAATAKAAAGSPTDPKTGHGAGLFFYEIRAKRRSSLPTRDALPSDAEWSRDSLQIFFTARDIRHGTTTVDRIFWDGSDLKRYLVGSSLVIGD
jgi:hypothetical protein